MPAALPLTDQISQASSGGVEYRILEVQYGNGYSQRAADGINNAVESWDVSWENIHVADFNTISAAFDTAKGADYFTWTPPGSATQKRFVVKSFSKQAMSGDIYTISASLKQVF